MWYVKTADGRQLVESPRLLWPQLPPDIVLTELGYLPALGTAAGLRDCQAYGFQRFRVDQPGAGILGSGAQLIGVKGERVIVVEFNEVTGSRRQTTIPRSKLTYAPGLLRHGRG
jgi:hypothetical protein